MQNANVILGWTKSRYCRFYSKSGDHRVCTVDATASQVNAEFVLSSKCYSKLAECRVCTADATLIDGDIC
jgi:hypothetical protein